MDLFLKQFLNTGYKSIVSCFYYPEVICYKMLVLHLINNYNKFALEPCWLQVKIRS